MLLEQVCPWASSCMKGWVIADWVTADWVTAETMSARDDGRCQMLGGTGCLVKGYGRDRRPSSWPGAWG
jgi:hypothetical protein